MKNKEIEEILNERKIDTYAIISKEEAKTILSYIEQLETEIKELNDSITWWKNRYNAVNKKGYINFCYELESLLKGDSDDTR